MYFIVNNGRLANAASVLSKREYRSYERPASIITGRSVLNGLAFTAANMYATNRRGKRFFITYVFRFRVEREYVFLKNNNPPRIYKIQLIRKRRSFFLVTSFECIRFYVWKYRTKTRYATIEMYVTIQYRVTGNVLKYTELVKKKNTDEITNNERLLFSGGIRRFDVKPDAIHENSDDTPRWIARLYINETYGRMENSRRARAPSTLARFRPRGRRTRLHNRID